MKTILVGDCHPDRTFRLADPDAPNEAEFEYSVVRALSCAYPNHRCVTFGGSFVLDGVTRRPDLALVARDLSHWFVIEVELVSHSLEQHVLPQVRAFVYGEPQQDCISVIADRLDLERGQAATLVALVPRSVVVVANKRDLEWVQALRGLNAQMLTVSIFQSGNGVPAVEIDGDLQVVAEHLGFGVYSAVDRSLRFPASVCLPRGDIQLADPSDSTSLWIARDAGGALWVTKVRGVPDLDDGSHIQIVRTYDGRLSMRRPRR